MNNNALSFRVRPCIICGFPFSDEHHIHPEILGREKSPTVILCPNHHRLAHIIQGMVVNNYPESSIFAFANQTLDAGFNAIGLPLLLNVYKDLSEKLDEQLGTNLQEGDPVIVCIDCDYRTKEHIYRWGILKRRGLLTSSVYIPIKSEEFQVKNNEIKVFVSFEEKTELIQIATRIEKLINSSCGKLEPTALLLLDALNQKTSFTDYELWFIQTTEEWYNSEQ